MNLFGKRIIVIICTLSISVGATVAAREGQARQSYPLPIAELNQVATNWLNQNGYDVTPREREMGIIQLTCSRTNQNWTIILRPQSALATEVTVNNAENESNSVGFEEELSAYINLYLNPNKAHGEESTRSPNIPKAIFSKSEAVVCIQIAFNGSTIQFSGFIIDPKGTIICTTHDLEQFRTIKITDSRGQEYTGELIKVDTGKDLALIQTNIKPRAHVSFSKGKQTLQKGTPIYSIGCPVNRSNTVIAGSVNKPPVRANQLVYWRADIEIYPGSSGSPVFDSQGELVGMIKGRYRGNNSVGFLIPTDRIKKFINEY
jgi:serine protease Do